MKVWMSHRTQQKNHIAVQMLSGLFGILALAFLLILGTAGLILLTDEYREAAAFILCLFITSVVIFLAFRLGRSQHRDATIFCRDDEDRLYVLDVRQWSRYRRGLTGSIQTFVEIEKNLEAIKNEVEKANIVPPGAVEILKVESIKEHPGSYSLVCWIRNSQEKTGKWTYHLVRGYEDEEELRYLLERKRTWNNAVELKESRNPVCIFLSLAALVIFGMLCLGSHPYFGILSQVLYFPCLGGAMFSLSSMIYFIIKYRRGE